jgi:hypothetical protein
MLKFIKKLFLRFFAKKSTIQWTLTLQDTTLTFYGDFKMRFNTEQKIPLAASAVTASGNPAPIDGEIVFTSSDPNVVAIEGGFAVAKGEGVAQITATADRDLGEGVDPIVASGAVEVVRAGADRLLLVFGEPVSQ